MTTLYSTTFNIYISLLFTAFITICPIDGVNILQLTKEVYQSNCSISGNTLLNYYLIKCPASNVKLDIILEPNNRTTLTCFNITNRKFQQILPNITIGLRKIVEITNCPLPENKSISIILQNLGLIDVKSLIFNNNKWNQNLSKTHLSNLWGLRNLTLKLDSITILPYDLFKDLSLKSLNLLELHSNVKTLPTGIITNLEHLEVLILQGNLHSLSNDLLDYQIQLLELNLSNNKLKNLTKEFFKNLTNLQVLHLQNNLVDILDNETFIYLPNLRQLDLSGNKFSQLPQGLLTNNKKLKIFTLSHNRLELKFIPTNLLADLPDLSEITLECGLDVVPRNLFKNSINIKYLQMSNNKFRELPVDLFGTLRNLEILNLSYNDLEKLPGNIFQNTTNLKELRVSHNKLRKFSR